MTYELNYEGFKDYLLKRTFIATFGVQYIFKFDNGFGASVIKNVGSYGHENDLWEVGVVIFGYGDAWHLTYKTPITNDVVGNCTDEEVRDILSQIQKL